MHKDTPSPDPAPWQGLLDEFRTMGGVAHNIVLRPSASGRGLFPENPERPVCLLVPDSLLFRTRDIGLVGDRIGIADGVETEPRTKSFFERYQTEHFCGGARTESARLIDMFDSLQPELRNRLAAEFGLKDFVVGDREKRIFRYFFRSRAIRWRGDTYLVPLLDRMNRGERGLKAKPGPGGGLQIEGSTEGEILLSFDSQDSLGTFTKHGIAVPRMHAYSVPTRTKAGAIELVIGRDVTMGTGHPGSGPPQMQVESGNIHLSYLTVGNVKSPRLPRGIFYTLMRKAGVAHAEDAFDKILFVNRTKFLSLLEALEPLNGELVSRLRRMAHFQLAALAECVGARTL